MSAHAPRNKLLALLNSFPYTKSIVINHGEAEIKKKFREYLLENLNLASELSEEQVVISGPEVAFRIESTGIVDKFATNFESIL